MRQLALISSVLVLLHIVYQMALCVQVHKPIVIFFILVVQCVKLNAITVAIVHLNVNFAVQSSTDVAIGHAQVIHNVCAVFYFIFSFFILWGCKI